jgi:Tfp pilus assembly protein PilF
MRVIHLLLATAMLLAGCETAPFKQMQQDLAGLFESGKGESDLAAGIRSYENANYGESARQLQSALDQGLSKSSQLQAHKYLAFIHCVSGRQAQCRNEFRKALTVDPDFELGPAEAGHPIWGPVFLKEKTRRGG